MSRRGRRLFSVATAAPAGGIFFVFFFSLGNFARPTIFSVLVRGFFLLFFFPRALGTFATAFISYVYTHTRLRNGRRNLRRLPAETADGGTRTKYRFVTPRRTTRVRRASRAPYCDAALGKAGFGVSAAVRPGDGFVFVKTERSVRFFFSSSTSLLRDTTLWTCAVRARARSDRSLYCCYLRVAIVRRSYE